MSHIIEEIAKKQSIPVSPLDKKVEQFASICNEITDLYQKKNHDYGDAFSKSIDEFGDVAALVRINDKFNRLKNLILVKDREVMDESVQDTLKDMASYCIMFAMEK